MHTEIITKFTKPYLKNDLPEIHPGDTVRVHQRIKEGDKERVQIFEGTIIALKHGKGISGTFTVRKISGSVGVERIFPLHAPFIEKIELVSHSKVRRAKLYYLRNRIGKSAKLKRKEQKQSKK
jgi:large subunit ribosomal protein L19